MKFINIADCTKPGSNVSDKFQCGLKSPNWAAASNGGRPITLWVFKLRASLHEPGLDTDPGQFLLRSVERDGNYLSVRKMADQPCNHQNHQFVLTLSAILPRLFACAQLHGFLMLMLQQQQLQATHRVLRF